MVEHGRVVDAVSRLARAIATTDEVTDLLHALTHTIEGVVGAVGVGVALVDRDELRFATSTSEPLAELERVQEREQEGPCVDATRTVAVVDVDDVRHRAEAWPAFVPAATASGVVAAAAVPMVVDGNLLGAVSFYDPGPRRWSAEEVALVQALTDMVAVAMWSMAERDRQRRLADQLQRALNSRVKIEQAKGIIAARRGVGVDEAFRLLRRHANDHNLTLHAVAEAVVDVRLQV